MSARFRDLVAARKREFGKYESERLPNRFETLGSHYEPPADQVAASPTGDVGEELTGTACCPGVVKAEVRLVSDPNNAGDLLGRIMVAERTDPGWVTLFPMAKGILVERGSLLSHSAIVAREMGIPAIVGVEDLMRILRDGEEIEMDGGRGVIRLFR